jgi:hypothetical protein
MLWASFYRFKNGISYTMNLERIEHNFRDKVFEKLRISTEGESRSDQTLFRRVYDMTFEDRRLMEDYLPIRAISAEGSREKSIRKGHISTLHLWWGRRPLVACHAVVYGALVPADQFRPKNGPLKERNSLGRFLSPVKEAAVLAPPVVAKRTSRYRGPVGQNDRTGVNSFSTCLRAPREIHISDSLPS